MTSFFQEKISFSSLSPPVLVHFRAISLIMAPFNQYPPKNVGFDMLSGQNRYTSCATWYTFRRNGGRLVWLEEESDAGIWKIGVGAIRKRG